MITVLRRSLPPCEGSVLDRLEAQQQRDDGSAELELKPDEASLNFLQKIYRSSKLPLPVRMRAVAITLPFESPKLTAMAVSSRSPSPSDARELDTRCLVA